MVVVIDYIMEFIEVIIDITGKKGVIIKPIKFIKEVIDMFNTVKVIQKRIMVIIMGYSEKLTKAIIWSEIKEEWFNGLLIEEEVITFFMVKAIKRDYMSRMFIIRKLKVAIIKDSKKLR